MFELVGTAPTTEKGRRTRARVLAAATTLVRERGVAATTLDAVEQAAGVGRSQLYHYFDDRDDLLRAVVATTADTVLDRVVPALTDLDTLAGLDRWFATAVDLARDRGGVGGCPIGSLVSQVAEQDDGARAVLADAFHRWETPLVSGLTTMRERGELRADTDVGALADFVMAALQGGLLLAQVRRDPGQLASALAGARTAVVAALAAR